MSLAFVAPVAVLIVISVLVQFFRAPLAKRLADFEENVPRKAVSLAITWFFIAFAGLLTLASLYCGLLVLYGDSSPHNWVIPVIVVVFSAVLYVLARSRSEAMGEKTHAQWSMGKAPGETPEMYATAFRARAWIFLIPLMVAVIALLLWLVGFGALGTPADLPGGMNWK